MCLCACVHVYICLCLCVCVCACMYVLTIQVLYVHPCMCMCVCVKMGMYATMHISQQIIQPIEAEFYHCVAHQEADSPTPHSNHTFRFNVRSSILFCSVFFYMILCMSTLYTFFMEQSNN